MQLGVPFCAVSSVIRLFRFSGFIDIRKLRISMNPENQININIRKLGVSSLTSHNSMVHLSIRSKDTQHERRMMFSQCPHCGITWEGEEVPVRLMATGHYTTLADAEKAAANYGWTPENQHKFNINVIGVEIPDYDGVSYWHCTGCGTYFDRWTGLVVEKVGVGV